MERGISRVESGEHDAAMADFQQAEHVAEQAGLDGLISASRINQGYAYTVQGDTESAVRLYEQAVELTRAAGDAERLTLALANLSVELKEQGRHADAIIALTEYIELLGDQNAAARGRATVSRAMSSAELGDFAMATFDLDEAGTAATEADDSSLLHLVRMSQASVYVRIGDLSAARIVLEQALDAARASGDPAELQDALMSLAQVCRLTGLAEQADDLFTTVEDEYRAHDNTTALADALYWHGIVLGSLRRPQSALAKWHEEEAIRRQHGQDGHLAECLYAQADALRVQGDHEAADPLFREAGELFEKLNMTAVHPSVLYWHGVSLRAGGKSDEALRRADEALRVAVANGDPSIERRAQGLRALALADLGEIAEAQRALDAAESLSEKTQAHSAMVWTLTRRAYVIACDGGEPQDVVEQLRRAHEYALTHGQLAASRTAARRVATDIVSRCDESYAEPLETFGREQLEETSLIMNGGMPLGVMTPSVETATPTVPPLQDDELDDSSSEE